MKLLPQFHIILPVNTPAQEVEVHARARLKGALAQKFEILKIKSVKVGTISTKFGPVHGEQFLIVLQPLEEIECEEEGAGEVIYEHPDCKKLLIH